jgi:sodium pump decarboxylase gamma subunit
MGLNSSTYLGLEVGLLGMAVVFAVLIILYLSIVFLGRVIRRPREPKQDQAGGNPQPAEVMPGEERRDDALVAAIAAAVAQCMETPARVIRITRVSRPCSQWAAQGRLDIMNTRLSAVERKG